MNEFRAWGLSMPGMATFFSMAFRWRWRRKRYIITAATNAITPPLNPAIRPMVPAEREEDTVTPRSCVVAGGVVLGQNLASFSNHIKEMTLPGRRHGCYWITINQWRWVFWRRRGSGRSGGSRSRGSTSRRSGGCGWVHGNARTDCCGWNPRTIACTIEWTSRQWVIRIAVAVWPGFGTQGGHIILKLRKRIYRSDDDINTPTSGRKNDALHLIKGRGLQQVRRESSGQIRVGVNVKLLYGWRVAECAAKAREVVILQDNIS